jgi:hypothetical protein
MKGRAHACFLAFAGSLFTLACHQKFEADNADASTKLMNADPAICLDPKVHDLLEAEILPRYVRPEQSERVRLKLVDVSLANANAQQKRASCSANAALIVDGRMPANRMPIQYEIRAALDQPGQVLVIGNFYDAHETAKLMLENMGLLP